MHHLRTLSLAGNPITQVMNDSFLGLDKLEFLDISDIRATEYQVMNYAGLSRSYMMLSKGIETFSSIPTLEQGKGENVSRFFSPFG